MRALRRAGGSFSDTGRHLRGGHEPSARNWILNELKLYLDDTGLYCTNNLHILTKMKYKIKEKCHSSADGTSVVVDGSGEVSSIGGSWAEGVSATAG